MGGQNVAIAKLKSPEGWQRGGNGNNVSGFSGLPGGYLNSSVKKFENLGLNADWWLVDEGRDAARAYQWGLSYDGYVYQYENKKTNGYTVRCIKE